MTEENQEMIINYETVYELLRREKSRDEVQKLPDNFVQELSKHIRELGEQIAKKRREIDSFGEELRKEEQKYYSLKRIINELYEKRERKIINMAITKSRTNAKLADVANLLEFEKDFFNTLVETLNYYRKLSINEMTGKKEQLEKPRFESKQEPETTESNENQTQNQTGHAQGNRMVRFLHAVPKFFDKEMNVLGPFEPDEVASLPSEIVDILVKKGRAEEINNAG